MMVYLALSGGGGEEDLEIEASNLKKHKSKKISLSQIRRYKELKYFASITPEDHEHSDEIDD